VGVRKDNVLNYLFHRWSKSASRFQVQLSHGLASQPNPAFNRVNLHNWRITGFQDWLRTEKGQPASEGVKGVLEAVQKPVEGHSNS
jgi:hypothetical protein